MSGFPKKMYHYVLYNDLYEIFYKALIASGHGSRQFNILK
jgi:hypothetical protein